MKIISRPPLPFQGNKFNCKKYIDKYISLIKTKHKNIKTIVDVFGGSLYVSYYIKKIYPEFNVICNDYDNYIDRLQHVQNTKIIFDDLNNYLNIHNITRKKRQDRLTPKETNDIKNIIKKHYDKTHYIDLITVCSSLLFSGSYTKSVDELIKYKVLYNRITTGPKIDDVNEYINVLNTCEIIHDDYKNILMKYENDSDVLLIADPPYLYTDKSGYNCKYWKLSDSLEVLKCFKSHCVFFTSTKSGHEELIDFFNKEYKTNINYKKDIVKRNTLQVAENVDVILYNL